MKKLAPIALALGLAGCTPTLTDACLTSAAALRVATVDLRTGKMSPTAITVTDHAAAVIDGFCHPGAKEPTDLRAAIQAVIVAGGNIAALHQ